MFILDKNHPKVFCGNLACMHACSQTGRFDSRLWRWNMDEIWEFFFCFCWIMGKEVRHHPPSKNPPHLALPVQHLSWDAAEAAECRRMVMLNCWIVWRVNWLVLKTLITLHYTDPFIRFLRTVYGQILPIFHWVGFHFPYTAIKQSIKVESPIMGF